MNPDQIIIEPVMTEKTNALRESNKYVFRVNARANKIEIMRAVTQLFAVHPLECRVMNVNGKPKRLRYKQGRTASWKKAIVTLSPGDKIAFFEGA
jgi:large subunit ribosomal protein L23